MARTTMLTETRGVHNAPGSGLASTGAPATRAGQTRL